MIRSFVIGNGTSRSGQPVENLVQHGTVYACNYASVELPCDHGIAVDRSVIFDLLSQHKPKCCLWSRQKWCSVLDHSTPVYALPEQLYKPVVRWDLAQHWSSGTYAVWKAANDGSDIVVMLGFDLWNNGTNNNLYANKNNYSTKPVDPRCWIHQLLETFSRNPDTMFVNIQPDGWSVPDSWNDLENFTVDNYANLWNWLKN